MADDLIPPERRPGRGAGSNAAGRFEALLRLGADDGWGMPPDLPPLRTEVSEERPRRIISRNDSPDLPFDRSINPYRGCEHGCVYCFARPSHAWLGLSPGLDFETRLIAKPDAAALLARELRARGYKPQVIAIGTNTDPYQPVERERRIMRGVLEVLLAHRHPVAVVTKGALVERDLDLLAEMAALGLASVGVSVTTLDAGLARAMEPRVPAPARRLVTIRRLSEAGVPVRVFASPVIPGLTDHELEAILAAAREAGAVGAAAGVLRLPGEVAGLFQDWLAEAFPGRARHVMGRVREIHGGRDTDPRFGLRMTGQGPWAALLANRLRVARRRLGLDAPLPPLRTDLFRVPDGRDGQMSLF